MQSKCNKWCKSQKMLSFLLSSNSRQIFQGCIQYYNVITVIYYFRFIQILSIAYDFCAKSLNSIYYHFLYIQRSNLKVWLSEMDLSEKFSKINWDVTHYALYFISKPYVMTDVMAVIQKIRMLEMWLAQCHMKYFAVECLKETFTKQK